MVSSVPWAAIQVRTLHRVRMHGVEMGGEEYLYAPNGTLVEIQRGSRQFGMGR